MRKTFLILSVLLFSLVLTACYTPYNYGPPPPPPAQHTPVPGPFPPGQPPVQGEMCGGMMGARCSNPSDFCQYSPQAQCGAADQSGVCSPRPQMCTQQYQPVCTCSGKTYSNACVAASHGESVVYEGQCRQ